MTEEEKRADKDREVREKRSSRARSNDVSGVGRKRNGAAMGDAAALSDEPDEYEYGASGDTER